VPKEGVDEIWRPVGIQRERGKNYNDLDGRRSGGLSPLSSGVAEKN